MDFLVFIGIFAIFAIISPGALAATAGDQDKNGSSNSIVCAEKWLQLEKEAEQEFARGNLEAARKLFLEAISEAKSKRSPSSELDLALSLNQYSHLLIRMGDYEQAHEDLLKALDLRKRNLGEDHLLYGETLGNLGLVCSKLHRDDEAENYFEQSLAVKRARLKPDDPALAVTLHNLARLYGARKDYSRADSLLKEVLRIDKSHYGPEHIEVILDLTSIGINAFNHGLNKEAIESLEEALALSRSAKHPDKAARLQIEHYLGLAYGHDNQPKMARKYYEAAHSSISKLHGVGHPLATIALLNLARNTDQSGDTAGAESMYLEALEKEKSRKPQHLKNLVECYTELGHFYRRHDSSESAEKYYRLGLESFSHLKDHEKRSLSELPRALYDLLAGKGDESGAKEISARYLRLMAPHSEKHFRLQ